MRTIQMTLDDQLLEAVDKMVAAMGTTRSAFTRKALCRAIAEQRKCDLEQQHRLGYLNTPAAADEFSVWEEEQDWGDR